MIPSSCQDPAAGIKYSFKYLLVFCFTSLSSFLAFGQGQNDLSEIPRLSPLPASVAGVGQSRILLNGIWDFQVQGLGKKSRINVPGEWEMQGFTVNEGETAVYSLQLAIPSDWKGQRVKLRFDAVSSHAIVKINEHKVGEHEGGFAPFEVEVTEALKPGRNLLTIEVQALTISDRLASTSQYAVHTVGGLLRKVVMFVLPPTNISSNVATTVFDARYRNATLKLQSGISNESSSSPSAQVQYSLVDARGKVVFQKLSPLLQALRPKADVATETTIDVKEPFQWNPEHPYLYKLKSTLLVDGKAVQSVDQMLGFRQVEVKGHQVVVNGKSIKLHGVNHHSIYPLTGRSVSPEMDKQDAELFRNANCNYIRTSHYPPSEEFLNAADSLGLFVESEASLCWIGHFAAPYWKKWNYKDEKFLPYMVRADVENVLAGRSHPSIIIWSLGNESVWSPLWNKVLKVVKKLDPSRPTTFHDQCWGAYNNEHAQADIAVYHYPDINGPAACDTTSRPVLFGEYAHISCYNRRELLTDPGIRSSYGKPLMQMYDSIYYHKGCLGGAIWAGVDDIFHMPDGRIVGYGPWGSLDGWRRQKPEYFGMKKAYAPVRVKLLSWPSSRKPYIELSIENRYDFTSLDSMRVTATLNGRSQAVKINILPHSTGVLKISASYADALRLRFDDPRGFVANEEYFDFYTNPPSNTTKQASHHRTPDYVYGHDKLHIETSYTEDDGAYFVIQDDVRYSISKSTGVITSARRGDSEILKQGPVFCMVPMNREDGGKPNVASESYQNTLYPVKNYPLYVLFAKGMKVEKTPEGLKFSMEMTYSTCKGKQSYLFTKDGRLTTEYEIHYTKADISPYQYGLLLQLPKSYDLLSWRRKAEFTGYSENDIGRAQGKATLAARPTNGVEDWGVEPKVDWKDDANEMGSNDFRSTKRYIQQASLSNEEKGRVMIFSDGSQSSRTWFQDERINWLIADYSNNGSEPFYTTPHSTGHMKITEKVLKGKLTLMLL